MRKSKKVLREAKSLRQDFAKKIKTVNEVRKLIGKIPRKRTVIMCHGAFDIVHPGHIRQLIYAKSKGDILIVSVVADKYVTKRPISPYVPQELRALNLAAFEIVDHVILDSNPTPVQNILKLQPDYFLKGFEYQLEGTHPDTTAEKEVLSTYGGELVFSPGDIVYSSTKLLSIQKPNLSLDQLLTLMSAEGISFEDLRKTIKKFNKIKTHVLGDVIVDKYSTCSLLGAHSKHAALSVRLDGTNQFVGGAGVVAKHLKALGGQVTLTTVLGNDKEAKFAVKDLKSSGVKVNAVTDKTRPTTSKERFFVDGGTHLMLQVDKLDNRSIAEKILSKITKHISKNKVDAFICSDFRHGIFNKETVDKITNSIPKKVLKVADSQVSSRWGNILDFSGFDLITPNEKEARFALGDQDTTIRPLAQALYNKAGCRYLILKLGENGIMIHRGAEIETREFFYIDSFVDRLIDSIGAGDALLAVATLVLVASKNIVHAAILGNMAAAIECSKLGNEPVSSQELIDMTYELENKI